MSKDIQHTENPPVQPAQTPAAPEAPAPVQYVLTKKSLDGVGGWLVGWLIWLVVLLVLGISGFFSALNASGGEFSNGILVGVYLFFWPLIILSAVAAIICIAMRKKLGKLLSLANIAITGLFWVVGVSTAHLSATDSSVTRPAALCLVIVLCSLQALYFFQSERVKQTLTK